MEYWDLALAFFVIHIHALRINGEYTHALTTIKEFDVVIKNGEDKERGELLHAKAVLYRRIGELDKALRCFRESLAILEKFPDYDAVNVVRMNFGTLLINRKNYHAAYKVLFSAYQSFEEVGEMRGCAMCCCNIGSIYRELGDYEKALEYFSMASGFLDQSDECPRHISMKIRAEHARLLLKFNYLKKAGGILREIDNLFTGKESSELLVLPRVAMAELLLKKRQFADAFECISDLFPEVEQGQNARHKVFAIITKTECFYHLERYEEGVAFAKEMFESIRDSGSLRSEKEFLLLWFKMLKGMNLKDEMLEVSHKIIDVDAALEKDSNTFNRNNLKVLAEIMDFQVKLETERALVDEKEKMNHYLEERNKDLDDFVSIAAHDLKSPIRTIHSFAKLLEKKKEYNPEYLAFILEASSQMQGMLENLLDYARVGASGRENEEVNLSDVLHEVMLFSYYEIKKKEGDMTVSELPILFGDFSLLKLLFQNLLQNSIKFSSEHRSPVIEVYSEEFEDFNRVYFKDNGKGISEKDKEGIFKAFSRGSGRERTEGSGIGLATCAKIMKYHGGGISVQSELGKGSTFILDFPKGVS